MVRKYVMVRLRAETHAVLKYEMRRLVEAMRAGQCKDRRNNLDNSNPAALEITADQFIFDLLADRINHRERAAKSRERSRADKIGKDVREEMGL